MSDAASAERWIGDVLEHSGACMEAPLLLRMSERPAPAWNALFLASRETAELRAETLQMGYSLSQLLEKLGMGPIEEDEISYPLAYAHAERGWRLGAREALMAHIWAWLG